ncbi:YraN family protein [Aquabacterium sp.]|jgi:putative endonuclease|uniref:YraN family protein n=1 Tax=Aquabacterium sp. TaxID=1872578 RepID=UPI003BAE9139
MAAVWRSKVASTVTTKSRGDEAEGQALAHLQAQGLTLVERNYRLARGPRARGAEVDLIMRDTDGTLVFVEVRARRDAGHGGAAASVSRGKQRRCILGARHYLMTLNTLPPCRFDVVAIEGDTLNWIRGAFLADD